MFSGADSEFAKLFELLQEVSDRKFVGGGGDAERGPSRRLQHAGTLFFRPHSHTGGHL